MGVERFDYVAPKAKKSSTIRVIRIQSPKGNAWHMGSIPITSTKWLSMKEDR